MIMESHLLQFCRHSLEKNWILYWILHAGALLRCVYHMHSVGMKQNISEVLPTVICYMQRAKRNAFHITPPNHKNHDVRGPWGG